MGQYMHDGCVPEEKEKRVREIICGTNGLNFPNWRKEMDIQI